MLSRPNEWLAGCLVVEMGGRIAVGACGSLLSQAGATVVLVEPRYAADSTGKFANRDLFAAGKRSLAVDPENVDDRGLVADLLARADIVLTSSDCRFLDEAMSCVSPKHATVCNFTALGRESSAHGLTEAEVQALSGVAHTSGFPDGGPVLLQTSVLEYSAAVFGAAACAAALIATRASGVVQQIEVTLFDCAIHLLASFLPSVVQGGDPGRLGNGHPLAAPWNAYPSSNGWLLFCTASDVQWQKFCEVAGCPELAIDERYKRLADRAKNRSEVDTIVSDWTRQYDTKTCIELLARAGLAGGEIVPVDKLIEEANVQFRGSIVAAPRSANALLLPQSILTDGKASPAWSPVIPEVDGDRGWVKAEALAHPDRRDTTRDPSETSLPLTGVRVIEIGQFTTAPLSARHLAAFGAEVIKIEPPMGDAARAWAPLVDGVSIFFSLSNSGKACYKIDLRSPAGLRRLETLLQHADVLVENLKSGSLASLGLSAERLNQLNPRLIYCPITGFGNHSAYPGRPAFDTVVQAISGMMDANAVGNMPLKASASVCDVMGGEVALFAIIAALFGRQTTSKGCALDLSMQDIAMWVTAPLWNRATHVVPPETMIKCGDGYVAVLSEKVPTSIDFGGLCRAEAAVMLRAAGVRCVEVRTISEALNSEIGQKLKPVVTYRTASGSVIPLLAPPVTLMPARLKLGRPPGEAINLDDVEFPS